MINVTCQSRSRECPVKYCVFTSLSVGSWPTTNGSPAGPTLEGPHANRCGERLASGVSRRARRLFGQFSLRAAVFAHPTDATGTKGEITSIEASFDFFSSSSLLGVGDASLVPGGWTH